MAKEKTKTPQEEAMDDANRYRYGALASWFLGKEEPYAPGSLEMLAGKKGLDLGKDAEGFVKGTFASEKGIQTASSIYTKYFQERVDKLDVSSIPSFYGSLKGLDEEDAKTIQGIFDEHSMNVGSLVSKVKNAEYILKDPGKNFTDEQKKSAEKDLRKLKTAYTLMSQLQNFYFEGLRPDAVDFTRKKFLSETAKEYRSGN